MSTDEHFATVTAASLPGKTQSTSFVLPAQTLAAASARDLSLQAKTTRAPRATSASLVASPTPAFPPVTMQIWKTEYS